MPDTPDTLHPQDKRGWTPGDRVAIEDPVLCWQLDCQIGTLTEVDFVNGFVYVKAANSNIYPVAFPAVRRVEDVSAYEINLFEWGEYEGGGL